MNKSDIKDYSAGLAKSIKSGKLTLEEAVIESSAATGCTKDFARKILSECLAENCGPVINSRKIIKSSYETDVFALGQQLYFASLDKDNEYGDYLKCLKAAENHGYYTRNDIHSDEWKDILMENPDLKNEIEQIIGYPSWYKVENTQSVKSAKKPIKSMRYNTLSELNNVINILWDINDVARSTCGEEGYQAIKTAITAVQNAWNICKQGMEKKGMDTSVYSSRKPIKSGITYDQALDMFTSEGKPWDDYWSMQYDWTAFVDSLEKNGDVDYEEARWWDNPCTPETFNEWVGRSNDDEYDEYYDDEWNEDDE